ncbi:MAG: FG-GAP-like repeat-containing protein [Burkholderiales bacterium]
MKAVKRPFPATVTPIRLGGAALREMAIVLLAIACATGAGVAKAQRITTVAGSEIGDGGAATAASLAFPTGVATDAAGNLYIADEQHHRFRKVDANGVISTFAGTGLPGFSGDGGPATAATFIFPSRVATDSVGNVYVADQSNSRVRRIDTNGNIATVAGNGSTAFSGDGGAATSAGLFPSDFAVDGAGNLYIADGVNRRIRKVDANGIISTIAGNGEAGDSGDGGAATAATLRYPSGVALDASGNLFIADESSHIVRRVDPAGIITTVAGVHLPLGGWAFGGDGGPATEAYLDSPSDVATDAAGNLYIADSGNRRVRKVDLNGIITTVAGNGSDQYPGDGGPATAAGFSKPHSIAIDPAGIIYIATRDDRKVRKVDTAGVITTAAGAGFGGTSGSDGGPATLAVLFWPPDVATDAAGNFYIVDDQRIRRVDASGTITTIAGDGFIGFHGDGGPATAARLWVPRAVAADPAGNVYIADYMNHRIRRVDAAGIITTVAGNGEIGFGGDGGPATAAPLTYPSGVAVGSGGALFIAEGARIRKVDANGIITTVAGNGTATPTGDGGPATAAGLQPHVVATDAAGNVYIAERFNNRVRKVDAGGTITTVAGNGSFGFSGDGGPATAASLRTPTGLAVDSAGQLFISDWDNGRIRKVDAAGIITTVAGNGATGFEGDGEPATMARLHRPEGLAFDSKGDLYFAEAIAHRIRKIEFSRARPASPHDFNADGKPDILWQNIASGEIYIWHMNGPVPVSGAALPATGPSWKVQGIADFNGDGHVDLVLRNASTGAFVLWYLANGAYQSSAVLFTLPLEWVIQGVADFNADGKPDLLMRNTTSGLAFAWFIENGTPVGAQVLFATSPAWKVEGVGDFNADGQPDLLFRDAASGVGFAWYTQYSGGALSLGQSSPAMYLIDPVWEVAQVADWNGDGKPDLLFRSATAGVVFVWYLDGTTLLGSDFVAQVDPAWEIVPRR